MKYYRIEDYAKTWFVEYRVDGMQNSTTEKILSFRNQGVGKAVNVTEIEPEFIALNLPNHLGTEVTEAGLIALCTTNNWRLVKQYETLAEAVSQAAYNTAKEVLSFSFLDADNAAIAADAVGVIDDELMTIAVEVPFGTVITALIAAFILSPEAYATIALDEDQVSGVTGNDFTNPVVYKIHSGLPDLETKDWTVTVTVAVA